MPLSLLFIEVTLDTARVAFALQDVRRVVRAVEVVPVPGAHACLLGMIDLHGEVLPAFDTRVLLGLPARPIQPSDHFVICRGARPRAFLVDEVRDSFESESPARPRSFAADASGLRGVLRREDGLILVHDMNRFMAFDEALPVPASHG